MAATYDRELKRILKDNNCELVRTTGKHPVWFSPISKINFAVPNGIASNHTANVVLKNAGIAKAF